MKCKNLRKTTILVALLLVSVFMVMPETVVPMQVVEAVSSKTLSAPTNIGYTSTSNSITLKWDSVDGADLYRVYKYDAAKKGFVKYKSVSSTSCKITDLKSNTAYAFKISSAYKEGNSYVEGEKSPQVKTKTKAAVVKIPTLNELKKGKAQGKYYGICDYSYSDSDKTRVHKFVATNKVDVYYSDNYVYSSGSSTTKPAATRLVYENGQFVPKVDDAAYQRYLQQEKQAQDAKEAHEAIVRSVTDLDSLGEVGKYTDLKQLVNWNDKATTAVEKFAQDLGKANYILDLTDEDQTNNGSKLKYAVYYDDKKVANIVVTNNSVLYKRKASSKDYVEVNQSLTITFSYNKEKYEMS